MQTCKYSNHGSLAAMCVCVCISWLESDFYSNFAGSFLMSLLVSTCYLAFLLLPGKINEFEVKS